MNLINIVHCARLILFLSLLLPLALSAQAGSNLMLANEYSKATNLDDYLVSEKYDGVRAHWNGSQLISRKGNLFNAPAWFTVDFPAVEMDGELWLDREKFALLSAIVRKHKPLDNEWRQVKYMVFDLPNHTGRFDQRLSTLNKLIDKHNINWLIAAPHWRVDSHHQLMTQLKSFTNDGAEGLMLHKSNSLYRATRSDQLLKLKLYQDAEATVIAHLPGKGQLKGMLGALVVESKSGQRFRVGTGFSYRQRQNPPAIGSIITYKFTGHTKTGLPRFTSYLRQRLPY